MAESVRELVVTLSMSAGTFSKTCADINAQIKGVQAEFNAITGGVDGWQTTMEGREAKLKALNETLGLQQTKIATIAAELEKAKLALAADPGNLAAAKKVSSLETQLNNAKTAANLTKQEIEKLDAIKLTNAANALNSFGSTLKTFGRKFSMYVGGPLAALGVTSFNAFKDYEMSAALLEGKLDAPKEEVDALVDAALAMSEKIPVSYEEIMALMTGLAAAGVPVENIEKMALVMSQLSAVTGMSADEVSTNMIMFMNAFGLPLDNVDQLSSALVMLADTSIATEADIFDMATRMAATGGLAGFNATQILSLSAAFASMGIRAEAGGTAASKLFKQLQLAAETGDNIDGLSSVIGVTAEEFSSMWKADPSSVVMSFFDGLSKGGAEGDQSVLALLDTLGLTEVRLSNLIAVGAKNPDMFKNLLGVGETGFSENVALLEKAGLIFDTVSGQMDVIQNTMKNTQADLGENVADVFSPIIEKVGELVTSFGELDEDTQTRWVNVGAVLIALGPVALGVGSVATALGKMVGFAAKIKVGDVTNLSGLCGALTTFLSTPVGAAFGIAAGLGALFLVLKEITTDVDDILANLSNVPITIDDRKKQAALDAIAQVQAAADKLSGAELKEEYSGTSAAVKAGYGTFDMFGQAVGYEKVVAQQAISDAAKTYAPAVEELNQQIADAVKAGDTALADSLAAQRTSRQAAWDQASADAMASYTAAMNDLVNGMIGNNPELKATLEKAAEEYDLFSELGKVMAEPSYEGWASVFTPDVIEKYLPDMLSLDATDPGMLETYGVRLWAQLIESMNAGLTSAGANPMMATLLQTLLSDPGNTELLDFTALQGALDGAVELLDWKAAKGEGKNLTQGLADGAANSAAELMTPAMNTIRDKTVEALQTAMEMHSPSLLMAREGFNIPAGVAQGILLGIPTAAVAMNALGAALTAIASAQGTSAGAAYGAAFSKQASVQLSLAINDLKRQLSLLEIRINRGYGSTS